MERPFETHVDLEKIRRATRLILEAIGEDPDRDGLKETPSRVAELYAEVFSGMKRDPDLVFKTFTCEPYDEIVLVRDIAFASMCEHHLMPFVGRAHVAYIPDGRVVGISKLARVVDVLARRPQIQERMTFQIAEAVAKNLGCAGTAVVVEGSHACMTIRGIKKPDAIVVTSAMLGVFRDKPASRTEVLDLILRHKPNL